MIDYEFTIRRVEKELSHYREMQKLQEAHMDAHDRNIEALGAIPARTEQNLVFLSEGQVALEKDLATLTTNVNTLVEALLREHKDGKAA
jgi:hypothetical protein